MSPRGRPLTQQLVKELSKEDEITHPYIRDKMPLGMVPHIQALLLARRIRGDIEEKRKEQRREEAKAEGPLKPLEPLAPVKQAPTVEYMLVQMVVRHGQEVIYKDVETDDGGKIDLSVAQYISYDLGADGLSFGNDLYNRMLAEAVEHNGDEGFNAESYFMHHPDIDISRTATEMAIDHFQLSKSLQVRHDDDTLRNQVEHLILDFRMEYVERRLKEIQREINLSVGDTDKMMSLMAEYKDMQVIRNEIAKELGNDIII